MVEKEDDSFKVFVRTSEDLSLKFRENETVEILISSNTEENTNSIITELNRQSDRKRFKIFQLHFFQIPMR